MITPPSTLTRENATPSRAGLVAKTTAYYITFIALGLSAAVLGPTLPGLAAHTQVDIGQISFLFTSRATGYLLGSLQAGRIFDRLPGHPLMAVMLILMAIMLFLAPMTSWLWLLALIVLLLGLGEGTLDVGGNTLLMWVHGRKVGPFMNGLHFFFGLGAFLAPVILAQAIVLTGDINWAYWLLALLVTPAVPLLLRLPSPNPEQNAREDAGGHVNLLLVALLTFFFFLYVGAESSFGGWIFTFTTAQGLSSPAAAAYLTSAFWGALTIGRFVGIPVASRLEPRSILLTDLLLGGLSLGIILAWRNSLLAVWIGTLGAGLGMASIFPTLLSFAERRMKITAGVSSWFFVGSGAGGMVLPWLIGQLFDAVGPLSTMVSVFIDILLLIGLWVFLILYSNRRAVET